MRIKAILFDFIGTTVIEKDPSILNNCFVKAFNDHNVNVGIESIKANRGRDKKEMIDRLLSALNYPLHHTHAVLDSFENHLKNNLDNFYANEGAAELLYYLKERKILIGLGTGLPRATFETILNHVGWKTDTFDYIGIAGETGRGRPYPDMIFDTMKKFSLRNDELLKVGDTVADVREGKNAKVMTVAILSGTQDEKDIISSQPDFTIRSLHELKQIFNELLQA
jgi:phosphonoacetaldehyde hydrolase